MQKCRQIPRICTTNKPGNETSNLQERFDLWKRKARKNDAKKASKNECKKASKQSVRMFVIKKKAGNKKESKILGSKQQNVRTTTNHAQHSLLV